MVGAGCSYWLHKQILNYIDQSLLPETNRGSFDSFYFFISFTTWSSTSSTFLLVIRSSLMSPCYAAGQVLMSITVTVRSCPSTCFVPVQSGRRILFFPWRSFPIKSWNPSMKSLLVQEKDRDEPFLRSFVKFRTQPWRHTYRHPATSLHLCESSFWPRRRWLSPVRRRKLSFLEQEDWNQTRGRNEHFELLLC